jgi:group II intron reverse transcriptase/maturase
MSHSTRSLREAVCHSNNLSIAFARYARQRGLWAPGLPMPAVTKAPARAILELAQELREGRFRPCPPRIVSIAKADGGKREITVYMMRDRVAHRALLQVLQARTDAAMSPVSFGYRPGRDVSMALVCVRSHLNTGWNWVADADIERCFDSIPHGLLLAEVERRLKDSSAPKFVAQYLGWDRQARREGTGIPQGSALSPWLCNVYLWRLDDRMTKAGIPMVRFADDFVLLARTREAVTEALAVCGETLAAMRLKLHPVKTRIVEAFEGFRFLGQMLTAGSPLAVPVAAGAC